MKRIALTLFPVLGLVGCGTLPAPPAETQVQSTVPNDGFDYVKMARAERSASQHGIQLVWVNPPRLKTAAGSSGG